MIYAIVMKVVIPAITSVRTVVPFSFKWKILSMRAPSKLFEIQSDINVRMHTILFRKC